MYDSSMVTTDRHFTKDESLDPSRPALLLIDVQPRRTEARMNCPHWLLALTIPFSRSDRAHTTSAMLVPGARRTVPDGLLRWRVSFEYRMTFGVIPTGCLLYQFHAMSSTHLRD